MVAKRHKITNVPLFKKIWDIIFLRSGQFRGQKSLGPLKMSLEMAHKVIVPQKKIISRSFLNSGTLIVILRRCRSPHLPIWLTLLLGVFYSLYFK